MAEIYNLGVYKDKMKDNFKTAKNLKIVSCSDGEHYVTGMFASFILPVVFLIICFVFLGAGIFVLSSVIYSLTFEGAKDLDSIVKYSSFILFSIPFIAVGVLLAYMFVNAACRKETWFAGNILNHRRNFLGFTWKKEIPVETIDKFSVDRSGISLKKNWYLVTVKHCAEGLLIFSSKGFWDLEIASGFKKMGEAEKFAKLINKRLSTETTKISKADMKMQLSKFMEHRDKILKRGSIAFGLWGLVGAIFCLVIDYLPIYFPNDNLPALAMILAIIPGGFTAARMTAIDFNVGGSSSKGEKQTYNKRFLEVLLRFPLSGIVLIGIFINALVRSTFLRTGGNKHFFSVLAVFFALAAFMNLRLFLGGKDLIDKWKKENN